MERTQRVILGCAAAEVLSTAVAWWLNWSPLGIGLVLAVGVGVSIVLVMHQRRA
ncbi:MAG: hypothetical protein M3020_05315 [Myxococcota bacterium]|nr:hypothetical protein [Myxococcota bacterium]